MGGRAATFTETEGKQWRAEGWNAYQSVVFDISSQDQSHVCKTVFSTVRYVKSLAFFTLFF